MLTPDDFYEWERTSRDTIDVKRCYIDIAGDLVSGILLSQIIYWFLPGEKGSKLRVQKQERLWLAKGRTAWWDECRISAKQFDRAVKILQDRKLVEVKRFRFSGSPTIHIWLNVESLVEGVNSILTKGEVTNRQKKAIDLPSGELQTDEKGTSLTENTLETTTETTTIDKRDRPSPSSNGTGIKEIFAGMHAFYGYPDRVDEDPIPNYGKEGKAIKRMLIRGFTPRQILDCWMQKCRHAGIFKSMVYVNEDIMVVPENGLDKYTQGIYGHMVAKTADDIAALMEIRKIRREVHGNTTET